MSMDDIPSAHEHTPAQQVVAASLSDWMLIFNLNILYDKGQSEQWYCFLNTVRSEAEVQKTKPVN